LEKKPGTLDGGECFELLSPETSCPAREWKLQQVVCAQFEKAANGDNAEEQYLRYTRSDTIGPSTAVPNTLVGGGEKKKRRVWGKTKRNNEKNGKN